jgi:hypothetical protein
MNTKQEKLDLPFRQLLWILFNLRKWEELHRLQGGSHYAKYVQRWQVKADQMLSQMGVTEEMDFENIEFTFIDKPLNPGKITGNYWSQKPDQP